MDLNDERGFVRHEWAERALEVLKQDIYEMLRNAFGLPSEPPPPPTRLERWRQVINGRYWRLRWSLAEKIAGEPIRHEWDD